ncbi:hypothetical protein HYU89_01440 [Candidatus Collierbacteria bacterium]|nr:hypothetical protein [Candidatus Collierbacteria bacterium]
MPLGETFNPLDSFGNQIWQPDSNSRLPAKIFLLYLDGEVKAGRVSDETATWMLSRLREAISPPVKISWKQYIPTTCNFKQEELIDMGAGDEPFVAPLPLSWEEIERAERTKGSIEKWVKARGGPQRVLKVIRENQWTDAAI